MTTPLTFSLVSPERTVFEGSADAVILPTAMGQITVLPGHIPLVSVIVPGEVIVRHQSSEELFAVSGGFLEVQGKSVTLLADASERASEIDEQRAREAMERAEKSLREGATNGARNVDRVDLTAALERARVRLNIVRKLANRRIPPNS